MARLILQFALLGTLLQASAFGAALFVDTQRHHLGTVGSPEWETFAGQTPGARRLDLRFNAEPNAREATLFIRQDDVRQEWSVELNGKRLGQLFLMEADLVHVLRIPTNALRQGSNVLSILPPKEIDDIVIQEIRIDPRPVTEALSEGTLAVAVMDAAAAKLVPCRLTIVDTNGSLAPVLAFTNAPAAFLATRPGVVYSGDGLARIGLPAGGYTVYASRGFEWSVATQHIQVVSGQVARFAVILRREVPTPGWVSCDTHVHTFTHSGHGDATLDERMLTLAGEGIELPIATDHNTNVDYTSAATRRGVAAYFTPVCGNEVTTTAGHFNLFPVPPGTRVPDATLTDWPRLMTSLRASPGARVIVLNHPRNVHNHFQPFAATNFNAVSGDNLRGPNFTFDAMELFNSSAQQSDYLLVLRDWFALLNHGYRITAVGSSDSHDVSRYIVGQGRTYIACPDADPGQLNIPIACSNLVAGRTLVSMGLLAEISVNEKFKVGDLATGLGEQLRVQVRVLGPSWSAATNVVLFANGMKIREERLSPGSELFRGIKAIVNWVLPRPTRDIHLVALATGPGVTAPYWAIPRPYQPTSKQWSGRVIAATNPIWIDADGDGQFSAARIYAQKLVTRYGTKPGELIPALADYDEPVAIQVASLCAAAGTALTSSEFATALRSAPVPIQRGFAAYSATLR